MIDFASRLERLCPGRIALSPGNSISELSLAVAWCRKEQFITGCTREQSYYRAIGWLEAKRPLPLHRMTDEQIEACGSWTPEENDQPGKKSVPADDFVAGKGRF